VDSQRREQSRSARWKIAGAIILAALIVLATVVLTSFLTGSDEDPAASPHAEPVAEEGASMLIGITADDGTAASIAVVSAAAQATPRLALLPPSILATLPGYGENTLANTTRFAGGELLDVTLANLLGIRVDATLTVDAAELANALAQDLTVELREPLLEVDGDARIVAMAAGTATRTPQEAVRLVVDRGGDDELTWLQRQGAVWEAVLAAGAEDSELLERLVDLTTGDIEAARSALNAAAADAVVTVVPATRIEPTGGEERYQLSGEVATEFVAQSMPYLALAQEPRVRIEVLNGNGQIGSTRPVAGALIRRGFRVILTDNADRLDYDETRIIAHGREHQAAALVVREIVARGEVSVEVRQPSGVVDVTIIVGRDLGSNGG